MNLKPETPLLAPPAAALAGWMLSGSPVPMALTVLLLPLAVTGGVFLSRRRFGSAGRRILSGLAAIFALWIELDLFRDGRALAMRADLPPAFHLGMALLWWASIDHFLRSPLESVLAGAARGLGGIIGGLTVLAASAGTVLYDFGPWEAHPVAALPLALWATRLLFPSLSFLKTALLGVLPTSILLTGVVLVATAATEKMQALFFPVDLGALTDLPARAPEAGGDGTLGDGASRRLPRDADVRFRREILFRLRAHSPELYHAWTHAPLYLRTSTLALFESDEILSPIRSGRWLYDQDDGTVDNTIPLRSLDSDLPADPRSLHTVYIANANASQLPLLEGTTRLHTAAVYEFGDDWYQLAPADEISRLRYTASAAPTAPAAARSSDLRRKRREAAPDLYLQMPPSPLSGKIRELCATLDPDAPLAAILDLLARRTSYSLRFSTPADSSPIEEFLFGEGRGHCELYASSTVLLLRSLGIPSRVAYGYAGGISDAGQQSLAFRDSDFHAWAEILTPENEWRIFDTTPRTASAASRVPTLTNLPPLEESLYADFSEFDASLLPADRGWGNTIGDLLAWVSRHFFLTTAAGLGLFAGLWWLLLGRREKKSDSRTLAGSDRRNHAPLPDYLRTLEELANRLGMGRQPGQTWREWLARLGERQEVPAGAEKAVAYHYNITYGGKNRDPAAEKAFRESLETSPVTGASD